MTEHGTQNRGVRTREKKGREEERDVQSLSEIRTCDAHLQNLAAVHEVVELDGLEEPRLLDVLAVLELVLLEELPVRRERAHALVEAYLRFLCPLCRLCRRRAQQWMIPVSACCPWRKARACGQEGE